MGKSALFSGMVITMCVCNASVALARNVTLNDISRPGIKTTQVKMLTRETNLEVLNVSYDPVEQYFLSLRTKPKRVHLRL